MGHANREIIVAARPSLFTVVRISVSVNRAWTTLIFAILTGKGTEWLPNRSGSGRAAP
jgi:hypothetical protein